MKKIIKNLILVLYLAVTTTVSAATVEVSCNSNGCDFDRDNKKLFDFDNIYPTWKDSKTLKITNNYEEERDFLIEISNNSFSDSIPSLFDVISITIYDSNNKKVYGSKSISELKDNDIVSLSSIQSGESEEYTIKVKMEDVGNEYQNIEGSFDLKLGFEVVSEQPENNVNIENIISTISAIVQGSNITPTVSPTSKSTGDVKGISEVCSDNILWLFALILQFVIAVVCYIFKPKLKKISYIIYLLINIIIMYYLYNFFCQKGYLYLSIVVFITFIIPIFYIQKKDKH